jgi:hypothetical protein
MWNVFYINNFSLVPCFKRTAISRIKPFFILVLLLVSGFFHCALLNGEEQQHDPLNYEVSVSVTGVPFLAVDERGNPVYDLKEDELELYVNRRLTPIHKLTGMVFRDMTGSDDRELHAGQAPEPLKDRQTIKPSRLIILVVDSLFNSNTGLSYSKQLARKIIENSPAGDLFLLLKIELGGLKYIAGPESRGQKLLESLEKIEKYPYTIVREFTPFTSEAAIAGMLADSGYIFMSLYGSRMSKRVSVEMYRDAFKQLKNALRAYDGPKLTYLLTEGFAGHMYEHRLIEKTAIDIIIKDIEDNVHDGGSVLKWVPLNNMRPHLIQGTARWLMQSTSAYYELFFETGQAANKEMNLKIRCKRKGVRITAVGHKEKEKPYREMSNVRKKTFAIGVAAGLNWKQFPNRIKQVPYKKLTTRDSGENVVHTIQVQIPGPLQNRTLDLYLLRFDHRYQDVDIVSKTKTVKEVETLTLQSSKEKRSLYFVMIEPDSGLCIFNRVL